MSRILITGATGRVAGVLATRLASDHDVTAVARFSDPTARTRLGAAGVRCVTADLADPTLDGVPDDAEVLLNFAVSFSNRWDEALAVNAEALGHLVDRQTGLECLVHCSTMGVYAPADAPRREDGFLGDVTVASTPTYSIS